MNLFKYESIKDMERQGQTQNLCRTYAELMQNLCRTYLFLFCFPDIEPVLEPVFAGIEYFNTIVKSCPLIFY
ncbi:hypothetical protein DU52_04970 [Methanosarcina mazei]|uniref:Uncharacterized protein n=2 Tax=Methanosarcina mazei TaxID=2209 RepID=A0A0F8GNE5_METMZ|nr:hypothetical protein DU52_04970 [Methanosarcina mazei]KKG33890.1 hypothetical protein DU30_02305 [Methanosarcina mazei]KKG63805.1 hypothetical protein DU67_01605 [Methanosarcina mazei]KKH28848.1 hypothetical protein DU58_19335 [Methanosarcina mazei]QCR15758.1 hypothetical protein DKM28_06570 [Methanosarcina mazei]